MKLIKAIFSGKGLPKRGEKGFTLVELLIVLAILAVLAAVVIPNVTGMFGRGAKNAFETDLKTIQTGAASFYFDLHDMDGAGATSVSGHVYSTSDGLVGTDTADEGEVFTAADAAALQGLGFKTIYMGLLVNSPGAVSWEANGNVFTGESGPYLNEHPKSSAAANGNPVTPAGSYTWTIGADGKVFAFWKSSPTEYTCGFGEIYP